MLAPFWLFSNNLTGVNCALKHPTNCAVWRSLLITSTEIVIKAPTITLQYGVSAKFETRSICNVAPRGLHVEG